MRWIRDYPRVVNKQLKNVLLLSVDPRELTASGDFGISLIFDEFPPF